MPRAVDAGATGESLGQALLGDDAVQEAHLPGHASAYGGQDQEDYEHLEADSTSVGARGTAALGDADAPMAPIEIGEDLDAEAALELVPLLFGGDRLRKGHGANRRSVCGLFFLFATSLALTDLEVCRARTVREGRVVARLDVVEVEACILLGSRPRAAGGAAPWRASPTRRRSLALTLTGRGPTPRRGGTAARWAATRRGWTTIRVHLFLKILCRG